jgi:hypothetical protein
MLAKHTAVLLWITLGLLLALGVLRLRPFSPTLPWIGPEGLWRRILSAAGVGIALLGLAAGVVWLGYGGSFACVENPAGRFPDLGLPAWVHPLFTFLDVRTAGRAVFFWGHFATETPGWIFFPVAYAIKTPVGILILLVLALATLRRSSSRLGRFLGVPCLVYLVVVLFWVNIPMGIRYMLPLYPLIILFIATQLAPLSGRGWRRPVVLAACAWTAAASLWIHPHYLAYFSELVGGPGQGHRYLLESNIDWGQDLGTLASYLRARGNPPVRLAYFGAESPSDYGIRWRQLQGCQPARGLVAISVNVAGGLYSSPDPLAPPVPGCYDWLKEYQPVASPGYSILVYDIHWRRAR